MRTHIAGRALALAAMLLVAPATTAGATATATVVYGDNGSINWRDPDVRPPGFILGQMFITELHWSSWGALHASATGIIHVCPSSVGCTRHKGTMYLHHMLTHRGRKYFREMTLRWRHHVQRITYSRDGGTAVFWH
jgi:hypothetical protein